MNFYSLFPFVLLLSSHVELPDSLRRPSYFSVNFLSETKLNLFFFFLTASASGNTLKKFYLINDSDILPKYLIIVN